MDFSAALFVDIIETPFFWHVHVSLVLRGVVMGLYDVE